MYILRRLLPFGVFSIGLELLYKTGLMAFEADKPDFAAAELLKTFGVMLLTTVIATLYMLIPYMLFLLSLPAARRNGKLDRAVTVFMYASFVFALLFEKTASFVFWDEFSAAFNFIAVDYLVYTNEVIANIYQSYPVNLILSALLAATAAIVWLTKRFLFPAAGGLRAALPIVCRRRLCAVVSGGVPVCRYGKFGSKPEFLQCRNFQKRNLQPVFGLLEKRAGLCQFLSGAGRTRESENSA